MYESQLTLLNANYSGYPNLHHEFGRKHSLFGSHNNDPNEFKRLLIVFKNTKSSSVGEKLVSEMYNYLSEYGISEDEIMVYYGYK